MDYISNTEAERDKMLKEIGIKAVEELFQMIPEKVTDVEKLNIADGISELELMKTAKTAAEKNKSLNDLTSFLGAGAYDHYQPAVIDHLVSRSEFYTAYTPYQAELSQGILEAIYEYQSMISELTGMGITNASMLDGGSAAAEAVTMAARITSCQKIILPESINPAYREVIKTYAYGQDLDFIDLKTNKQVVEPEEIKNEIDDQTAAVVLQYPNFYGSIEKIKEIEKIVKNNKKTLFIIIVNPILLGVLKAPVEIGADIVVGEAQSLGSGLNYGGPYLGFMAIKDDRKMLRQLPGRLVGKTKDVENKEGFVLTLQTREQHIRREKATSNICTNEALNALMASIYLAVMGKEGLKEVGSQCYHKAHYLAEKIDKIKGFEVVNKDNFFHEFLLKSEIKSTKIIEKLLKADIIAGYDLTKVEANTEKGLLISVTEKRTKKEMDKFIEKLEVL